MMKKKKITKEDEDVESLVITMWWYGPDEDDDREDKDKVKVKVKVVKGMVVKVESRVIGDNRVVGDNKVVGDGRGTRDNAKDDEEEEEAEDAVGEGPGATDLPLGLVLALVLALDLALDLALALDGLHYASAQHDMSVLPWLWVEPSLAVHHQHRRRRHRRHPRQLTHQVQGALCSSPGLLDRDLHTRWVTMVLPFSPDQQDV